MLPKGYTFRGRSPAVFQVALAVLVLAGLLVHHFTATAAPPTPTLWVADQKVLKQVDPSVNQYIRNLVLSQKAEALAIDPGDGALWALSNKHLLKFSASGTPLLDVDLKRLYPGFPDPKHFTLDPYDGSLWVAGEKALLHLSASGQKLSEGKLPDNIKALALDTDQTPWLLTEKQLLHLSVQGSVTHSLTLKPHINDPKHLSVDGLGGVIWIGSEKNLLQFNLNDLTQPPRTAVFPAGPPATGDFKIEVLGIHPVLGTLWVLGKDTLLRYDRNALYLGSSDLTPYALGKIETLAFEPIGESLWLGGHKALGRFTASGAFVTKLPADHEIEAIATGPFTLKPTLSLLAPPDNGVTNNPRPNIRLGLGANCSGTPCTLVEAYTQAFTLDATLNGITIGSLFTLANREALYIPPTRLPEGINLFGAQAKDVFGHLSNRITSQVTIDTIPPTFLSVAPADGTSVSTTTVTVSGQVNDSSASVMLKNSAGMVLNVGGATFSFSVTLAQGLNSFTLSAQDAAGNATTVPYRLTLNAVAVTILSPVNGASINASQTVVSGTFQGPANTGITVNGQAAFTFGSQFFTTVPLTAGPNILTAQATAPQGQTATHSVTVTRTSTTPDPAEVRAEPLSGIAPLTVRFSVRNNSATAITRIDADFDGNGSIDFTTTTDLTAPTVYTYAAPGIYQPRISVTQGAAVFTQTLVVGVNDAQQMDQLFASIWTGMNNALARGDVNAALSYLNESAKRKYQRVFTALLPQMPQIVASYSSLRRVSISESIGEYAINRTITGRNKIFLIYFLKDQDGVWRLDAM